MSSANRDRVTSSFPTPMSFVSFSCLIAVGRKDPSVMWKEQTYFSFS